MQSRTPQQEEQLRALKLERDFERRAEEAKQEDEEEGEEEPAVTVGFFLLLLLVFNVNQKLIFLKIIL